MSKLWKQIRQTGLTNVSRPPISNGSLPLPGRQDQGDARTLTQSPNNSSFREPLSTLSAGRPGKPPSFSNSTAPTHPSAGLSGSPCSQLVIEHKNRDGRASDNVYELHQSLSGLLNCESSVCRVIASAVWEQCGNQVPAFTMSSKFRDARVYIRTVLQQKVNDEQTTDLMDTAKFPGAELRRAGRPAWSGWTGDGSDTILVYLSKCQTACASACASGCPSAYLGQSPANLGPISFILRPILRGILDTC